MLQRGVVLTGKKIVFVRVAPHVAAAIQVQVGTDCLDACLYVVTSVPNLFDYFSWPGLQTRPRKFSAAALALKLMVLSHGVSYGSRDEQYHQESAAWTLCRHISQVERLPAELPRLLLRS